MSLTRECTLWNVLTSRVGFAWTVTGLIRILEPTLLESMRPAVVVTVGGTVPHRVFRPFLCIKSQVSGQQVRSLNFDLAQPQGLGQLR